MGVNLAAVSREIDMAAADAAQHERIVLEARPKRGRRPAKGHLKALSVLERAAIAQARRPRQK